MVTRPQDRSDIPTYRGPTLAAVAPGMIVQPEPACASCPAGSWYLAAEKPLCFCTAFRSLMYGGNLSPVTACDAREAALDAMAADLGRG